MKILYLAFACNPFAGSEAQCGWSWPMAMRGYADVSVLTREENRADINRYLRENKIDDIQVFYHDIPPCVNLYYKKGKLYHLYYLLWQKTAVSYVRKLQEQHRFDYIHHVTLGDFRSVGGCWRLKPKFIFGPVGGAQTTPAVLRAYTQTEHRQEVRRERVNRVVGAMPSYRRALDHAEYVFAANKETQAFLQKRMSHPERCRLLTENGVRGKNLKKPEKKTEKEKVALLWAGRMVNRKGLALLLDILKLVKTKKEYVLRLAGNGPEMENLKRQTADLGLKDKVEFLGKVSYKEMRQIYANSDIFVFPSLRETTGSVLFEAMANGIPVITFRQNGGALLIDDSCGRTIPLEQSLEEVKESFAQAIRELTDDFSLRVKLGQNAYRRIEEMYTWEKKCKMFRQEYLQERDSAK